MHKPVKLEASVACAHLALLAPDLQQLADSGVDYLHVDIMDGRFVTNFGLDFSMMQAIREVTSMPLDCHLMIEEPERYIDRTIAAGATFISVHLEATRHIQRTLQQIRDGGAKAGIALNPATPLSHLSYILGDLDMITVMSVNPGYAGQKLVPATLTKINDLDQLLSNAGYPQIEIQVDGNVSFEHIPSMVKAGATMLVGGTSSNFSQGLHHPSGGCRHSPSCLGKRACPMITVHSYPLAVMLCVLTMLCWGSWANTLKMEPKSYGFALFYWDQAIGYLLLPLIIGLTFGSFGHQPRPLFEDLRQANATSYAWAIVGGVVFNLANMLFMAALDIAGMAVAYPIAIGIALVEGVGHQLHRAAKGVTPC